MVFSDEIKKIPIDAVQDKIMHFLNQEKSRRKFNHIKEEIDNYLRDSYGGKSCVDTMLITEG